MTTQPKTPGGGSEAAVPLAIVAFVVVVVGGAYGATHLAAIATDTTRPPANPIDLAFGLINGEVTWSTTATIVAVAIALAVLLLVVFVLRLRGRGARGRVGETRIDHMAKYMGRGADITPLTLKAVRAKKEQLRAQCQQDGFFLGNHALTKQPLLCDLESTMFTLAGTRVGKTSSQGIPQVLEADGAVLVTSNKRDLLDGTRGPRAKRGTVWAFDPQKLTDEEPTWWWNPLSFVTNDTRALTLAKIFASNAKADGATTGHPFFDAAGTSLLQAMLLAAALDKRPIIDVYLWLTNPSDDTAVGILTEHGYTVYAKAIISRMNAAPDERSGVYSTAALGAEFLANQAVQPWVMKQGEDDDRPHFDPAEFVRSTQSLYLLSEQGDGSAGTVVTALTVAVLEATKEYGKTQYLGRLPVPMLVMLDEAANVCRWDNLPKEYSHFGSRGIVLNTILQSWSQGVGVWGETGMKAMWSAATIKVYLGGVEEDGIIESMSKLIGDYDKEQRSVNQSRSGRSVTYSHQRARILEPSDLSALARGRAIIFASGARPTLARTVPWMRGPRAQEVKDSILAHDPNASVTLRDAESWAATMDEPGDTTGQPRRRRWWKRWGRRS